MVQKTNIFLSICLNNIVSRSTYVETSASEKDTNKYLNDKI